MKIKIIAFMTICLSANAQNEVINGSLTVNGYSKFQGHTHVFSTENERTDFRLTTNMLDAENAYIYNHNQKDLTFHTLNIGGSHHLASGITILGYGNVGIGTANPGTWKLAVNGKIRAKEIKVETGWSDFVFYDNYKLPSLEEVERHIKEKGHLKDIPSAQDVEENGIFLGEMDSKLLQKIEELTLYTIQQEKRLDNFELKNEKLEKENESLKNINLKLLELQKRLEKLEKI